MITTIIASTIVITIVGATIVRGRKHQRKMSMDEIVDIYPKLKQNERDRLIDTQFDT